jgi:hypothetical protein
MGNLYHALQLIVLLTGLGTVAKFSNMRSALAREAFSGGQVFSLFEQTDSSHSQDTKGKGWHTCYVASEVTSNRSAIWKGQPVGIEISIILSVRKGRRML